MRDDPLKRLLREADAAAGRPPLLGDDLARRVRELADRRRRRSAGLSAAAALVLAVGLTLLWSRASAPRPKDGSALVRRNVGQREEAAAPVVEIERLRNEAELRLAVARRAQEILEQMKRAEGAKQRQVEYPDPVASARREVENAAYTLVYQADRMCRELDLCDSATVKYQRVVELFPETPWAAVARQRLKRLRNQGEIS